MLFFIAPSADLIKRHVTYDFEVERTKLRDKLQKIPGGISVTTDIWTTETYDKSFMSVTIHYLNSSWKLRSILLDFISMKGSHTGIAISNAMETCLQEMRITSKLIAITRDNASSNNRFLQEFASSLSRIGIQFDSTQQSIRCFGHILNLAVQSMLDIVGNELERVSITS